MSDYAKTRAALPFKRHGPPVMVPQLPPPAMNSVQPQHLKIVPPNPPLPTTGAPPPPPPPISEVPETITDVSTRRNYVRGKFLGKGGFARCYEVKDARTNEIFACKIVSKTILAKQHQQEKMAQEISIHRDLDHPYVVKFYSFFEDDLNVYVILELCSNKSLMEMQKRRRSVTEVEAKYILLQILEAVCYLHDRRVIHRDLKLGNIFINEEMCLKLGDFGLATICEHSASKRYTLCGTPNYIAPEILVKRGHSFEVDIWSTGCILYTLLCGKPPFETTSLKETYLKIRKGDYIFPPCKLSSTAKHLITKMLQVDPFQRPSAREILNHEFFTKGFIPRSLPTTVLIIPPRLEVIRDDHLRTPRRFPLIEQNQRVNSAFVPQQPPIPSKVGTTSAPLIPFKPPPTASYLKTLVQQLVSVMETKPTTKNVNLNDECEDPSSAPILWVTKWVDYSDKYGFGYQLSDDSIGVSFNDNSKMILLPDKSSLQYIDRNGMEFFYNKEHNSPDISKKIKLLNYFQQYMSENLLKAGGNRPHIDYSMARLPTLWTWFRTSRAVVMVLTNGTLQINNFRDHSKTILCPLLGAITTLEPNSIMKTYRFGFLEGHGCNKEIADRITYAIQKLKVIVGSKSDIPESVDPRESCKVNGKKTLLT